MSHVGVNSGAVSRLWVRVLTITVIMTAALATHVEAQQPFDFTRMVAHRSNYSDPDYLTFIQEVQPEVVQVGFYGGHFWSLAHTPYGKGYPAHFPLQGHQKTASGSPD